MNLTSPAPSVASSVHFGHQGRVCIVTGGAQGIGEACVRRFAAEGAKPVIVDVDDARGHALAQALGGDAMRRWGEIEVMAKLLDQPAHLMLRRVLSGEGAALIRHYSLEIRRCDTAELWLVLGRRPVICR